MLVEEIIDSVELLIRRLNEFPSYFLFRGQADANWKLQSSLERVIGESWSDAQAMKFEDASLKRFQSKFHLYDRENINPSSKLAWLSIMQHYGVPTRLLDFTESPYVALYFALESYDPQTKKDLAVFSIDYRALMEQSISHIKLRDKEFNETPSSINERQDEIFEKIVDRFSYDIAWIAEPAQLNTRLDRQAGSFLLSGNRGLRVEQVLSLHLYSSVTMIKTIIPHELYPGIYALLRKMNITSKSLYGNLDGLARSIKMELQVYS